jgi:hypothetical protein
LLLTIQCIPDDYRPVDTQIEYDSLQARSHRASDGEGMRRTQIGDVTIYTP